MWQIYPQHDAVHWQKLQAFLKLYQAPLGTAASQAMQDLWRAWNGGSDTLPAKPADGGNDREAASYARNDSLVPFRGGGDGAGNAWPAFAAARDELERHAQDWAQQLAKNNLALNLLDFYQKIGRMRAFEIEG